MLKQKMNMAIILMAFVVIGFVFIFVSVSNVVRAADINQEFVGAVNQGHWDVVKSLLEKGADINARADNGVTALMMASYEGAVAVVNLLLNKGADVNDKSNNGFTALLIGGWEWQPRCGKVSSGKGSGCQRQKQRRSNSAYA